MPNNIANRLLRGLSTLVFYLKPRYYRIVSTNLEIAFPNRYTPKEKKDYTLGTFYRLGQAILGLMKRGRLSPEELTKNIHFQNEAILLDALRKKEKIIFIMAHYGNWELLPPAIASKYNMTIAGIGRKLDSSLMDKILLKNRERFGIEMLYRRGAMKGAMKALKENKSVCFLLDQSLGEKQGGIRVDFFGKPVGHSPAVSVLARNFDATLIPAFISTDDYKSYTATFYPPIPTLKTENKEADIHAMTQAQASITEEVIRQRPQEWFWVHKRWKVYLPELYGKHL